MFKPAILALADGTIFKGQSIGVDGGQCGEVVFNTSMTGYQEILTDPSYAKQIITLTYPHIGNVGCNPEDLESKKIWASGLVIRDLLPVSSNWRQQQSLGEFLQQQNLVAIAGIDTRRLTRILREKGAQSGYIFAGDLDEANAVEMARSFAGLAGMDLAREVTTSQPYHWQQGSWQFGVGYPQINRKLLTHHVVVYDFGVKQNILRLLVDRGCYLTVVPAQTPAAEVLALKPDGIFLSNGPGDPAPCDYAIDNIQQLLQHKIPLLGICLGHQLLALACGANTYKMKFGHHGANHPVQDLKTKQVFITSQNHGFAVNEQALPDHLKVTHRSLFDNSIQGIAHQSLPVYGFQGHPEASPGPHDIISLFDKFIASLAKDSTKLSAL